jgi:hypothetical protein
MQSGACNYTHFDGTAAKAGAGKRSYMEPVMAGGVSGKEMMGQPVQLGSTTHTTAGGAGIGVFTAKCKDMLRDLCAVQETTKLDMPQLYRH